MAKHGDVKERNSMRYYIANIRKIGVKNSITLYIY